MKFLRTVRLIWAKDILQEMKSGEILFSMTFFSLLAVVLFHLSLGEKGGRIPEVAAGVLWVIFVFSGVLGLNRSFVNEKENRCMDGLLLAPVGADAVFAGKMLANFTFIFIVEALTLFIFGIFFRAGTAVPYISILIVVFVNTVGFCSVGTILAAMAVNTKNREVLLPLLLYPVIVPLIISGAESTEMLLNGKTLAEAAKWIKLSAAFDVIYIVVPALIFERVVKE